MEMKPMKNKNPEQVKCPVCDKIGYTDERTMIDGEYPCTKHYLEIVRGEKLVWSWKVTTPKD